MPYFGGHYWGGSGASAPPDPSGSDTSPAALDAPYCTDEDVAVLAPEDFASLAPRSVRLASGTDGTFDTDDRWTLLSETNYFATQGCAANHVCLLGPSPRSSFGKVLGGVAFAVNAATDGGLQLRHLGKPLGKGVPPAPSAGLTGVEFAVPTFAGAIDDASREANRRFGIDPDAPGKTPSDLKPSCLVDLRLWTALTVLQWGYVQANKADDSDFKLKLALVTEKLGKVSARLQMLWGTDGKRSAPTGPFSGRAVR